MDKTIAQEVLDKIAEMKDDVKSLWRKQVKERAAKNLERLKRQLERKSQKWELLGYVADAKGELKKTKKNAGIPVYAYVGWDANKKYTGEKLRRLRREQTLQAVAGRTHYNDGTPIVQDRLIDLWK